MVLIPLVALLAPLVGWFAHRKGYSFPLWMLSGLLGLFCLAFLPFASTASTPAKSGRLVKIGNAIGACISVFTVAILAGLIRLYILSGGR